MNDINNAIEILGLFIEKADRLRNSILVKSLIANEGIKLDVQSDMGTGVFSINYNGPDVEQVDAFLFTMRMFIQDGDQISFREMENMLDTLCVAEDAKLRFKKQRNLFNNFLDSKSMIAIEEDHPTYREIMKTVLYGYRGHLNSKKYSRYKTWKASSVLSSIIDFEFISVLLAFIKALTVLENNCRIILKELTEITHNRI
jgi:hypothetical protein